LEDLMHKYEQYLAMDAGRVRQALNMEARYGVEKCKAGDASGIAAIEKALINAKFDLPPRG
jgi:hypothetical protein